MKRLAIVIALFITSVVIAACDTDPEQVELSVAANIDHVTITVEPAVSVAEGTEVTITAPEVDDYVFVHYEDVATGDVISTDASYTFTAEMDQDLIAIYASETDSFNLEVSSNHDDAQITITPEGPYEDGEEVTVETTVPDGYAFLHFEDDTTGAVLSTETSVVLTMDDDYFITAVFVTEAELAALAALEDFEGDLTHLESMFAAFENAAALRIEVAFLAEIATNGNTETFSANLIQRKIEDESLLSETILTVAAPELPEDEVEIHIIINETDTFYEVFVDVGFILDMIEAEEAIDARELFAFDSDILHVTVPQELREEFDVLFVSALNEAFDDAAFDAETFQTVRAELQTLIAYYDFAYFSSIEPLEVDAEIVNNHDMLTTVMITSEAMEIIFEDLFEDIYMILYDAEVDAEMPPYEDIVDMPEYEEIITTIEALDAFRIDMRHTPAEADSIHIEPYLQEFLMQFNEEQTPGEFENFELSFTITEGAEIVVPDDAKDIYAVLEELFMVGILEESLHYVSLVEEKSLAKGTYTFMALGEDHQLFYGIPSIDFELSTVEITEDALYINPVYTYNEEPVFTEPMSLAALQDSGVDSEEPPAERAAFMDMIEPVDREHLNIYQIIIDMMHMLSEEIPDVTDPEDPQMNLPEEDLVDAEDIEAVPRYPDSILLDAFDDNGNQMRIYGVEVDVETVYDHYVDYIEANPDWNINQAAFDETETVGHLEAITDGAVVNIYLETSDLYAEATEIIIYLNVE